MKLDDGMRNALWRGLSAEHTANEITRQYRQVSTAQWYQSAKPLTLRERLYWRTLDILEWPFKRLRDALVSWLGCDCE